MKICFVGLLMSVWIVSHAQEIEIIKKPQMMQMLAAQDEKIYVFNYWASWCAPCVKELPAFKQLAENLKDKNVQVVLFSLDFAEDVEKAKKVLSKKQITFKTYLLDETKYDTWISDVEPKWQGAIPATMIVKGKQRVFINEETSYEELMKHINRLK
jgi:thiol-disulfide isomerase/thioredoxin